MACPAMLIGQENGVQLDWTSFSLCADASYVLFAADTDKLWRYSTVRRG